MRDQDKNKAIFILSGVIIGIVIGILITSVGGVVAYKIYKRSKSEGRYAPKIAPAKATQQAKAKKALPGKDFFLSFEDSSDVNIFKSADNAALEISDKHTTHGKHSLKVGIDSGATFPGILWEVYGKNVQNWKGAKDLYFDVFNDTENSITLTIKLKSGKDYPKKDYRHNTQLEPSKMTHVSIPLSNIAGSCDISQISYVKLYVYSPKSDAVLFFDNIGIKKDKQAPVSIDDPQQARKGTCIFAASRLDRVFKDGKTLVTPIFTESASISLSKNEYESFQVIVNNGGDMLKSAHLELSDFVNQETGDKIDKANITWRIVGYVPTIKPYYPVKYVGLWPDPLMPSAKIDIEPEKTQPFWVTVYIPSNAGAGDYKGYVKVIADDMRPHDIPVSVHVYGFTLPVENKLKTAFDFYPHITKSRYPQKPNESNEAYNSRVNELNEKYIINMLKYRINPILNIDPFSEKSLAKVETYRRYGFKNFSIGKKGGTFGNNWPKTDEEIEKLLPLYKSYGETLKTNKMLEYQYIYTWDEGKVGNPQVAKICSMIHKAYPQLKNMVCYHGFWDPKENPAWGKDIDIWCFGIEDFDEKKMIALQHIGKEIWTYISGPGGNGSPNLVIDYDSIDYRIAPWLCWKYDIKGLLYWCVNWWPLADPFKTGRNTKWEQNGNGLLYYPGEDGPIASLRLEILRDGIEDYEYLAILREKTEELNKKGLSGQNAELYKKSLSHLVVDNSIASSMRSFTKDTEVLLKRREEIAHTIEKLNSVLGKTSSQEVTEDFSKPIEAENGKAFGDYGQFTFELFRNGTFVVDGASGVAWQRSNRYSDVAIIRSTKPLPRTYKISAVVGDIDYDLNKIKLVENDPQYKEGPLNENGCYLLAITDEEPSGHHTNDWWHQHRKICIDVDNNIWGHGMPHPIFMVYFDNNNDLASFNGATNQWEFKWINAVTYEPDSWYKVEIEKTQKEFIMRIYNETGNLLKEGAVSLKEIWNEDGKHPDYLVIGDPHENYYQGSMKIRSVTMTVGVGDEITSLRPQ